MDYEFDCPQYVDFENSMDDSHPEVYFDTRQSRHAFTPFRNVKTEGLINSLGGITPFSSDGGPYLNTRLAMKNKIASSRPVKTVSSHLRPLNPTSAKRARVDTSTEVKLKSMSLLPANKARRMTSWKKALKRLRKSKAQQQQLSITVPEPFSFQTDKRLKRADSQEKTEYKTVDFVTTLRSNKENELKVASGPVRPVPERLLGKRKAKASKTMAEQLLSFQTGLSSRGRAGSTPPDSRATKCPRITKPMTPILRAGRRKRNVHFLSQEQKEILEAEEMRKYQFKAQPMNRKILVPVGIKGRNTDKPPSVTKPLRTEKLVPTKRRALSLDRPPEFHARPVPLRILQGVTGLGKKNPVECTEPQSPSFALKKREETWKRHEEMIKEREAAEAAIAEAKSKLQGRHLRSHSQSLQSSPKEPKMTVPAPFSFQTRNQEMLARKEERIKQILEEEQKPYNFRANPMPSPTPCGIPSRKRIPSTKFDSFSFGTDMIARGKAFKWQKQMEEALLQQKRAMQFKANPCTVTTAEPFLPNKTMKPATEFEEFSLHSETRAASRSKYDEELKEKQAQQEAQLEKIKLKEEEVALQEIAALRAKTVHKANPVPQHQTFKVKHGLIPGTNPISPKFATDKRLKRKLQ